MAMIGVATSLYAFVTTPGTSEIPIYLNGRFDRMENKILYLFSVPVIQVLLFLAITNYSIRWKEYAHKYRDFPFPYVMFGATGHMDIVQLMKLIAAAACAIGAGGLGIALSRVANVLGA